VDFDLVVLLGVYLPELVELRSREDEPLRKPADPEWIAVSALMALEL
jgi:hypothetical protein